MDVESSCVEHFVTTVGSKLTATFSCLTTCSQVEVCVEISLMISVEGELYTELSSSLAICVEGEFSVHVWLSAVLALSSWQSTVAGQSE